MAKNKYDWKEVSVTFTIEKKEIDEFLKKINMEYEDFLIKIQKVFDVTVHRR